MFGRLGFELGKKSFFQVKKHPKRKKKTPTSALQSMQYQIGTRLTYERPAKTKANEDMKLVSARLEAMSLDDDDDDEEDEDYVPSSESEDEDDSDDEGDDDEGKLEEQKKP